MMRIPTNLHQQYPLETLVHLQRVNQSLHIYIENELKEVQDISPYLSLFKRRSSFKGRLKKDGIMPIRYARLHQHSYYSILDSLMSPKQMSELSEYYSAITDHGVLTGYFEFYQHMKKRNQIPIIGMEAYCEDIQGQQTRNHLVLLVENEQGLQNLIKLRSLAATNFHYRPHLKWEWLETYHEGLICLTACVSGEIPKAFRQQNPDLALTVLNRLISVFGRNQVFLEIQRHGIEPEEQVNPGIEWLSAQTGIPIVATSDSHYAKKEDAYIHGLVKQMTKSKGMDGTNYHLLTSDEMAELFHDHPEYLDNTLAVAERCQLTLSTAKERGYILPDFPLPTPFQSQEAYFEHICSEGFKTRYQGTPHFQTPAYKERLQLEIDIIKKMGFASYFNIVADFVDYAKKQGILVGPGRGSACGSIVSYVLGITDIDPLEHQLLFERFLNPDRISMPDIDIDFQDDRREEVIDYVKQKYGEASVSRIITIGRYKARGAIRAIQRVLNHPLSLAEKICKMIPNGQNITLELAMKGNPDLVRLYEQDVKVKEIIDLAKQIEGIPSHTGMHACGVVITKGNVSDYVPQCLTENAKTKAPEPTTELTMTECETLGLLKMDFLGLRALGVLGEVIEVANQQRPTHLPPLNFYQLPHRELGFYQDLAQGRTAGVFQLESSGMVHLMQELYQDQQKFNPQAGDELFARLVAGIALYRPGPMKEIPNFISNLMHPEQIHYAIPETASFLSSTYSVIVYQEQVMLMVRMLAGFSMGQSDLIRKAMGKKIEEILTEYGHYFVHGSPEKGIKGCIANGIDEQLAYELWEKMAKFGKYGFNRSHATGYAMIAARSGYLAHYYPSIYMAATLNSYLSKTDRIQLYMAKCQENGIVVLPPHINYSQARFSAEGNGVRFGLRGLKHMGSFADDVIAVRETYGPFKSYTHFILMMAQHSTTRKQSIESLIYSGALDCFPGTRQFKLNQLDGLLQLAETIHKVSQQQMKGFSYLALRHKSQQREVLTEWLDETLIQTTPEFEKQKLISKEYEYAGFYITEHPLDPYLPFLYHEELVKTSELRVDSVFSEEPELEEELNGMATDDLSSLTSNETSYQDGDVVYVAGVLKEIQIRHSKKNNTPFIVGELKDRTGSIKVSFFRKTYLKYKDYLNDDQVVGVVAKYEVNDFGAQLNVFEVKDLHQLYGHQTLTQLQIIGSPELNQAREEYKGLLSWSRCHTGAIPITFYHLGNQQTYTLPQMLNFNVATFDWLKQNFQPNQVRLIFKTND